MHLTRSFLEHVGDIYVRELREGALECAESTYKSAG
jgi:hypothetical protein